mmetsp:Transcript_13784/g.34996  ORF Transcript_13784/g.34996 Transcript_13784/m.34996 type:complete len:452 (-) Transcript_13784:47-1402(-)
MIALGVFLEVLAAAIGTASKQIIAYSTEVQRRAEESSADARGSMELSDTGGGGTSSQAPMREMRQSVAAAAVGDSRRQHSAVGETGGTALESDMARRAKRLFHLGAFMNIAVGPLVDASAYAFAPQIVVAPFACLDVVFNMLLAPWTLRFQREQITRAKVQGTVLVALGASLTAAFGAVTDEELGVELLEKKLLRPMSIAYFATVLVLLIVVGIAIKTDRSNFCFSRPRSSSAATGERASRSSPLNSSELSPAVAMEEGGGEGDEVQHQGCLRIDKKWRGVALGTMAGVLIGNVFFIKGLLGIVHVAFATGSADAFLRPTPYFLLAGAAGGAVLGHVVMRKGLAEYKGVYMITIFEGAHISTACLSGCWVMSELEGEPWWRFMCYWGSVLLIVLGMVRVASGNPANTDSDVPVPCPQPLSSSPNSKGSVSAISATSTAASIGFVEQDGDLS